MNRPFQNLESSGPLVFDGLAAVCWFVNMTSDVTSPRSINIAPGQLYTFVFTQNGTGGNRMNWPVNCRNAPPIDLTPLSTTVQNFVGSTGGVMYANLSPAWNQP